MNDSRCLSVEGVADALEAAADDPRKQHLQTCPRCQALAAEYRLFMTKNENVALPDVEEALRLNKALAEEIGRKPPEMQAFSQSWWSAGRIPGIIRWRYAAPALAAVLVVILLLPREELRNPDPTVMRGEGIEEATLAVQAIAEGDDGGLVLIWERSAAADSFAVQFLAANLTVLATVETEGQNRLEFTSGESGIPEGSRFFRVTGFKEGIPVIRSGLRDIP